MFKKADNNQSLSNNHIFDFDYLKDENIYLDSACQSLRPKAVTDAMIDYYQNFNACSGRGKYQWANMTDSNIEEARELVLKYIKLSSKDYICSFTLNTTYGINLLLNQLPTKVYRQVITSEIEHNSIFLPAIELAKKFNTNLQILDRSTDGSLFYDKDKFVKPVVIVNSVSNIDGRSLINIKQLTKDVHNKGGILIIDAAQTMAHNHEILFNCDADAICFSAHKMYSSSLGIIVVKKKLLKSLQINIVGGGMISSLKGDEYKLTENEMSSWLEPGLQAYAEIVALKNAIKWLDSVKINGENPSKYIDKLSNQLYEGLIQIPELKIINKKASPVISFYSEKIDSHRLAMFLSGHGIMARSGYFCCHHYLVDKLKMPPLIRFSVGLHNTENDIIKTLDTLKKFL